LSFQKRGTWRTPVPSGGGSRIGRTLGFRSFRRALETEPLQAWTQGGSIGPRAKVCFFFLCWCFLFIIDLVRPLYRVGIGLASFYTEMVVVAPVGPNLEEAPSKEPVPPWGVGGSFLANSATLYNRRQANDPQPEPPIATQLVSRPTVVELIPEPAGHSAAIVNSPIIGGARQRSAWPQPLRTKTELAGMVAGILCSVDAMVIIASGVTVSRMTGLVSSPLQFWLTMSLTAALTALWFLHFRVHGTDVIGTGIGPLRKISSGWMVIGFGIATLVLVESSSIDAPPVWLFPWLLVTWPALLAAHVAGGALVGYWQKGGRLKLRVAVFAIGNAGARTLRALQEGHQRSIKLVGLFQSGGDECAGSDGNSPGLDALIRQIRRGEVDEVIVAAAAGDGASLNETLEALAVLPVNVKLSLDLQKPPVPIRGVDLLDDLPVFIFSERPISGWGRILKRGEDLVIGAAALIALGPLMLIIASFVKCSSPGPVLFRQMRCGFNDNRITILKFRTMHHSEVNDPAVTQARRNDPRVTWVGRFLRKTSLDELPQLLNVLRGDMSLVGPRPHALPHNEYYGRVIDGYLNRHRVNPGITGWAQVNGLRGETDTVEKMRRRLQFDLEYIENWSLLLDLKILAATVRVVLSDSNAY
jgi:Undecaprenyl-phosphate glucose phosphotransferase